MGRWHLVTVRWNRAGGGSRAGRLALWAEKSSMAKVGKQGRRAGPPASRPEFPAGLDSFGHRSEENGVRSRKCLPDVPRPGHFPGDLLEVPFCRSPRKASLLQSPSSRGWLIKAWVSHLGTKPSNSSLRKTAPLFSNRGPSSLTELARPSSRVPCEVPAERIATALLANTKQLLRRDSLVGRRRARIGAVHGGCFS